MSHSSRAAELVSCVIETVTLLNERLTARVDVARERDAALFAEDGPLDSMSLVSLIADIEEVIEEKYGVVVVLASKRAFSQTSSPFASVGSLASYADQLIEEKLCTTASR
jgi:acyl carrier protein